MESNVRIRKAHSSDFKTNIVLAGLRHKCSIRQLCQNNQIHESLYYLWKKEFIAAGTLEFARKKQRGQKRTKAVDIKVSRAKELQLLEAKFTKRRLKTASFPSRLASSEKETIIALVQSTNIPKKSILGRIGVARSTYYRWLARLNETGTLDSKMSKPEYCCLVDRETIKKQVFSVLHAPPSDYGFNRTTWKLNELQEAIAQSGLKIGRHTIRRIIKNAGYRWLKARKVLTSGDPDYRQKLAGIRKTLSSLTKDDGFFSIDEYGPFAVKQRQGKKLVPAGETFTVPQFQKSKGALIMTAALELNTNQVTHFYSEKKNTEEMIKLLYLLKKKYKHLDRIFLSWDAASWHISKKLMSTIEEENLKSATLGGPIVKTSPLPAGAQFLNVIESVFSGMSRAIIHNSNYASKECSGNLQMRQFSKIDMRHSQASLLRSFAGPTHGTNYIEQIRTSTP
jgi:transposase